MRLIEQKIVTGFINTSYDSAPMSMSDRFEFSQETDQFASGDKPLISSDAQSAISNILREEMERFRRDYI